MRYAETKAALDAAGELLARYGIDPPVRVWVPAGEALGDWHDVEHVGYHDTDGVGYVAIMYGEDGPSQSEADLVREALDLTRIDLHNAIERLGSLGSLARRVGGVDDAVAKVRWALDTLDDLKVTKEDGR